MSVQFVDLFLKVDDVEGDSCKYGKNDSFLFRMVVLVVLRVQSYDIFFNWQREMFISQAGMLAYHIAFYKSGEKRNEFRRGGHFFA
ncbi:MAG: hypothetical protein IKJ81_07205, partial [Bacteroidales bacterium]|nr:hypothetical protein [Bacteroidales bacterium]